MQNHPQIAELYKRYLSETQSFRKVHRLIDLFESIIKTHTVLIVSEYVQHNKLSEAAKGLLAQGLRTPSLGTWQLFSRVLFEELQKENFNWFDANFPAEFIALDKALNVEKIPDNHYEFFQSQGDGLLLRIKKYIESKPLNLCKSLSFR